jgi:SPP1 family phage portal protein
VLFSCRKIGGQAVGRNKINFVDLCQGEFGRKIAYTGVDQITPQNVAQVLSDTIGIHNRNRTLIDYLYRYYKGDQPILYREKLVRPEVNNKVVENHALETVKFKAGQIYGEPIQYVCKKKKASEKINEQVDRFNDYLDEANADARNIQLGIYQSAVGTAYKAILREDEWTENGDLPPFRIFIPSPQDVYIVYSNATGKPMLSVQILKDEDNQQYYQCYSSRQYFKIQNAVVTESGINGFGGIPIVEYPNNHDRLSDIEIAITMYDAINKYQSDRLNGVEQFVQALMKFKNCEIDEAEFVKMVKLGAVSVKDVGNGTQSDVDLMTAELNQSESQVAKDDIYNNMLIVEAMPNRQSNTGGDTGNAVYLRNGWDFAERDAKLVEAFTKEAEKASARIILNIIRKTSMDVNISTRDFDVKITRNPTDNMLVKAQALDYLFKNKIHPLIALITCGLFSDPQKVYEMSLPYLGTIYPELADPDSELQKAQDLLNGFNKDVITE